MKPSPHFPVKNTARNAGTTVFGQKAPRTTHALVTRKQSTFAEKV